MNAWVTSRTESIRQAPARVTPLLQRRCARADHRCEDESNRKQNLSREGVLRRSDVPGTRSSTVPAVVGNVLAQYGQALAPDTRAFFEARFGQDFSRLRVHTGDQAAESAAAVGALAYTVGNNLVFARGQYSPSTESGRALLAHELTHTLQQRGGVHTKLALGPAEDRFEQEADRVAAGILGMASPDGVPASVLREASPSVGAAPKSIQRRLVVESPNKRLPGTPPRTVREDIRDYIRRLSASFDVDVAGNVAPTNAAHCTSTSRYTDRCLCDLHRSTNPDPWKIRIDDVGWPHTEAPSRRVFVHSSRSVVEFGAWGGGPQAGRRIPLSNPRALGHELCGHAWLNELRIHPPLLRVWRGGRLMGRPSHDVSVTIENRVARDMLGPAAEQRGTFSDPHHGESFARITVSGFPLNSASIAALSAPMRARLTHARNSMRSRSSIRADVFGHADRTGSAAVNARVSRQRAYAVRNHLTSRGIPASRFRAVRGKGVSECPPPAGLNPNCRKAEVYFFVYEAASENSP